MGLHTDNLFLETLPQPYQNSFCSRLEPVSLPAGTVLYEAERVPRYAFFITSGVASKMVSMAALLRSAWLAVRVSFPAITSSADCPPAPPAVSFKWK
jgi:hypothetical protein